MHAAPVRPARARERLADVPVKPPSPPKHLSKDAAKWWKTVLADYDLEPHHLRLLQSAAEAWDRMQQARQALADHGSLTFMGSTGDIKPHPAVAMERDARIGFARLVRELDLDTGAPSGSRPPAIGSNRR
jgi:P27 family predicted phage terminase small subunit